MARETARGARAKQAPLRSGRFAAALLLLCGLPGLAAEEPAPDFALKTITGENLRLSEYRGSPVVLAFWASWCPECPALLQRLAQLPHLGAAPGADGLRVLALSIDHSPAAAAAMAQGLGVAYPVLLDVKRDVVKRYALETIPAVVLVDRSGVIRQRLSGVDAVAAFDFRRQLEALE